MGNKAGSGYLVLFAVAILSATQASAAGKVIDVTKKDGLYVKAAIIPKIVHR